MKRIVALLGDFYHDPEFSRAALEAAFCEELAAGALTIVYADPDSLSDQLAAQPALFVLGKQYKHNPHNLNEGTWLDDGKLARILQYVQGGGRLLALHSGLCDYEQVPAMLELLRGYFVRHPKQNEVELRDVVTGETVLTIQDEHYFVECETDRTHVFLTSHSNEGSSIAGWEHAYGEGRVCALTPAHNRSSLLAPDFLRLLRTTVGQLLAE